MYSTVDLILMHYCFLLHHCSITYDFCGACLIYEFLYLSLYFSNILHVDFYCSISILFFIHVFCQ